MTFSTLKRQSFNGNFKIVKMFAFTSYCYRFNPTHCSTKSYTIEKRSQSFGRKSSGDHGKILCRINIYSRFVNPGCMRAFLHGSCSDVTAAAESKCARDWQNYPWCALFDTARYTSVKWPCPAKDKKEAIKSYRARRKVWGRPCAMDRKESQPGTSAASSMYTGTLQLRFNVSE